MPKVTLDHEDLPVFYCASLEPGSGVGQPSEVQVNGERAYHALKTHGTRAHCITFDDSVYWPTYALAYMPKPTIIGGTGALSKVEIDEATEDDVEKVMAGLEKKFLAQTAVSFVLSRVDSNAAAFDIMMRPRRLKEMTGKASLEEAGKVWREATRANNGIPPYSQSCDNHQTQVVHSTIFCGLAAELMSKLPPLGDFDESHVNSCHILGEPWAPHIVSTCFNSCHFIRDVARIESFDSK